MIVPQLLVSVLLSSFAAAQTILSVHVTPPSQYTDSEYNFGPSAALSQFLNLEAYELNDGKGLVMQPEAFIGFEKNEGVMVVYADSVADIIPNPTSNTNVFPLPLNTDAQHLMSLYLARAYETYTTVHTSLPESLSTKGTTFISLSPTTSSAKASIKSFISQHPSLKVAVLTPLPPRRAAKRQDAEQTQSPFPLPSPNQPIAGISTCYPTLSSCTNSTDSCSGHGECVLAKKASMECYVCACRASTINEGKDTKTTQWAGTMCERIDYSGDFVLLAGTTIGLLVFVGAAVYLLSSVGSMELPSVLSAGAGAAKRD